MRLTRFDNDRCGKQIIAGVILMLMLSVAARAHSPHHIITDLVIERSASGDGQVFIAITDQVFRSDDRNSPWKNLDAGLDIQHPFVALAISPNYESDNTVYAATSGDGVFRSIDRGDTWARIDEGLVDQDISGLFPVRDTNAGHMLLASLAGGGLFRRDQESGRWWEVLSKGVVVTALAESQDKNGGRLLLAGDQKGRIWRSTDGGRLWGIVNQIEDAGSITSIAASGAIVFVGTENRGLIKSKNSAIDFSPVRSFAPQRTHNCAGEELEEASPDKHVTSITTSGENTVFVTTWYNAVMASMDGGATWLDWSGQLSCDRQADSEELPYFAKLVVDDTDPWTPDFWLATFDGLFRAEGAMSDWRQQETLSLGMIKGFAVSQVKRQEPNVAIATYGGGFYLTENLGADWTIGNKGLATTRLTGIEFSRNFDEDRQIFAGADQRLLWSSDGGKSWRKVFLQEYGIGARISFKLRNWGAPTGMARAFYDPRDNPPVYPTHIISQSGSKRDEVLFATRFHGVKSFNLSTGDIEVLWDGTDRIMNTFRMSPDYEVDQTLFASIRGEGVIRSTDGGASWSVVNSGLEFIDAWLDVPNGSNFRRDVHLALSPDFATDGTIFAGSPAASGLYVSTNGGDTWRPVRLRPDQASFPVLAISISPQFTTDGTMIVSIKGHGLLRSVDRGQSFAPVGHDLRRENASIEHLAYSKNYLSDKTIVGASDEHMFVSTDAGESWVRVDRPVRYEDMRTTVVRFTGEWSRSNGEQYSAMTESSSVSARASVSLDFFGTGVEWIGTTGPDHGMADVFVDGELVETVDTHSPAAANTRVIFSVKGLAFGAHTIELVNVARNSTEGAGLVTIDAFDVLSQGQPSH